MTSIPSLKAAVVSLVAVLILTACGDVEYALQPVETAPDHTPTSITYAAASANSPLHSYDIIVGMEFDQEGTFSRSRKASLEADGDEERKSFTIGKPDRPGKHLGKAIVAKRIKARGRSFEAILKRYERMAGVLYVEENHPVYAAAIPNDARFGEQWGLRNIGQSITGDEGSKAGTSGSDIAATVAWNSIQVSSIPVAVVDTGIDYTHPDLTDAVAKDGSGNIIGYDFFSDDTDPYDTPGTIQGHGSHVSGIIGATGNNGIGVTGVIWNSVIIPVRFLGSGGTGYIDDAAAAITWAVNNGAKVINASYTTVSASATERSAILYALDQGVLLVAAAGNANSNNDLHPNFPASYKDNYGKPLANIIAVAASDQNDNRAVFSSGGGSNYGVSSVHLAAPGENILSTVNYDNGAGPYAYHSGTSMAAPVVTGAAALVWGLDPDLTYLDVKNRILGGVDLLPAFEQSTISGGRLNLEKALCLDGPYSPPSAPVLNSVALSSIAGIDLDWTFADSGTYGFRIERAADSGLFSVAATVSEARRSYRDTVVDDGRRYTYRIKSWLCDQESAGSNLMNVTVPLNPPTGISGISYDNISVDLRWTDTSKSEDQVEIERKIEGGSYTRIKTLGPNISTYTDTGLPRATYSYRIRNYNTWAGYSGYSPELKISLNPKITTKEQPCVITEAIRDTTLASSLDSFRELRDDHLKSFATGRVIIDTYYASSSYLAPLLQEYPVLRDVAKSIIGWFVPILDSYLVSHRSPAPWVQA